MHPQPRTRHTDTHGHVCSHPTADLSVHTAGIQPSQGQTGSEAVCAGLREREPWGGEAELGVPGGREELRLWRVPGCQGRVQGGGPALEMPPVEAEPCHRGRVWEARTRRVPLPRHLLEHRAGRSPTERAAAHRVQVKETQVLVSLGLRTDSRRCGNKHSLSAPASKQSRASQHRPPEPAARRQAALGTG